MTGVRAEPSPSWPPPHNGRVPVGCSRQVITRLSGVSHPSKTPLGAPAARRLIGARTLAAALTGLESLALFGIEEARRNPVAERSGQGRHHLDAAGVQRADLH